MKKGFIALLILLAAGIAGWVGWTTWQDHARETAYREGLALVDEGRFEDALALAEPHAESGDPNIDHLLAEVLLSGPEPLRDETRGLELQRRAADAGQHRAGVKLARTLLKASQEPASVMSAIAYLEAAADCGMPEAHYALSAVLGDEQFGNLDLRRALDHADIAAWAGHPGAQWNAAYLIAVRRDLEGSLTDDELSYMYEWLLVAEKSGVAEARLVLNEAANDERNNFDNIFDVFEEGVGRREEMIVSADPYSCGFIPPSPRSLP
jgi:TPR repeat protein